LISRSDALDQGDDSWSAQRPDWI